MRSLFANHDKSIFLDFGFLVGIELSNVLQEWKRDLLENKKNGLIVVCK